MAVVVTLLDSDFVIETPDNTPPAILTDYATATALRSSERSHFDPVTGRMVWFSVNVPRVLSDRSIAIHGANTNRVLFSEALDDAAYTKTGSPVITPNDTDAPDVLDPTGANDADRIAWAVGGSPGEILQVLSIPSSSELVGSFFVRAPLGSPSVDLRITDLDGNVSSATVVASQVWQRVFVFDPDTGTIGANGEIAVVENTDAAVVHVWGAGFVTAHEHDMPYVRTLGVMGTGAAEDVSFPTTPALMQSGQWEVDIFPGWDPATSGPGDRVVFGFEGVGGSRLIIVQDTSTTAVVRLEQAFATLVVTGSLAFSVDQKLTLRMDSVAGTITVLGATTGNGTFTGTPWTFADGTLQIGNDLPASALFFEGRMSEARA